MECVWDGRGRGAGSGGGHLHYKNTVWKKYLDSKGESQREKKMCIKYSIIEHMTITVKKNGGMRSIFKLPDFLVIMLLSRK